MTLRIVGAGLPRTGTLSLKLALEHLLGAPCHHMAEVFRHPEQIPVWHAAVRGHAVDWSALLGDYAACVDFPSSAFWRPLAATYPDARVLLSYRDADSWWRSADATIFAQLRTSAPPGDPTRVAFRAMTRDLVCSALHPDVLTDAAAARAAHDAHVAAVRAAVPPERLVPWRTGDGWGPLCAALGVDVPDLPFPHVNSTAEFRARLASRPAPGE